jgi:hypothetical protein
MFPGLEAENLAPKRSPSPPRKRAAISASALYRRRRAAVAGHGTAVLALA